MHILVGEIKTLYVLGIVVISISEHISFENQYHWVYSSAFVIMWFFIKSPIHLIWIKRKFNSDLTGISILNI